ncbi:MAG: hypothetical protein COX82_00690, partial [Candidatus Magasanikbacteria bacterium CG_4_10_14_0_2_um_filter_41_10]
MLELDPLTIRTMIIFVKVARAFICNVIVWVADDVAIDIVEGAKAVWATFYHIVDSVGAIDTFFFYWA